MDSTRIRDVLTFTYWAPLFSLFCQEIFFSNFFFFCIFKLKKIVSAFQMCWKLVILLMPRFASRGTLINFTSEVNPQLVGFSGRHSQYKCPENIKTDFEALPLRTVLLFSGVDHKYTYFSKLSLLAVFMGGRRSL